MSTLKNSAFPSLPPSINSGGYLAHEVDLSVAANLSVASHEVFTVTGLVRARLWVEVTGSVTSSGGASTLSFGVAGTVAEFISATGEDDMDAGEIWFDATPTETFVAFSTGVFDYLSNGIDIGYAIAVEATTVGTLVFHIVWEPLNSTGAVILGPLTSL